jgi:monofunctional glycosyltransferase
VPHNCRSDDTSKGLIIRPGVPRLKRLLFFSFFLILLAIGFAGGAVLYVYLSLPSVSHLKTQNPQTTALIDQRLREAQQAGKVLKVRQVWVGFDSMPVLLKESVRVAEDARFYEHDGIDYGEISEAMKKNLEEGRWARGASTITQQLAKNLYLSTEKSLVRKLQEYFLALRLERELSKNRIFHLYLNVIELGPGIFGVEAAARHFFDKNTSQLSLEDIVRLTAVIPKPLSENPTRPSRWLKWKARWILAVLRKTGHISAEQHFHATALFK